MAPLDQPGLEVLQAWLDLVFVAVSGLTAHDADKHLQEDQWARQHKPLQ